MAKSNDEIYDLIVALDKKVEAHVTLATWRMNEQDVRLATRATRGWQFWSAISASPIAGAVLAYVGIKTGTS